MTEYPAVLRMPAMSANRLIWLAVVLVGGSGLTMLYLLDPARSILCVPCVFHELTGLYCPGCGTTRALHQLLHGHVRAALGLNPLTPILLPWMAYVAISRISGRERPGAGINVQWMWRLLGVVIAYWVLRNVPVYPFSLLAP